MYVLMGKSSLFMFLELDPYELNYLWKIRKLIENE